MRSSRRSRGGSHLRREPLTEILRDDASIALRRFRSLIVQEGRVRPGALWIITILAFLLPSTIAGALAFSWTHDIGMHAAAILAYALSVVLVSRPGRRRLGELSTVVSVLAFVVCITLSYDVGPLESTRMASHWYYTGLHIYLVVLAARRRTGWSWAMVGIVLCLTGTYGARSEAGPVMAMLSLASPVGLLLVSRLLSTELSRLMARRREAQALSASARTDDHVEQDTVSASIRRVHDVRQIAGEPLERIAFGHDPVDRQEAQRFRLIEAQLRDSIRGRSISTPPLLQATRRARERGVEVDILDERGRLLPAHVLEVVARHGCAVLDAASAGSVTIRAFPVDDPTAVLIVHDPGTDDEDAVALEIAQGTGEVSEF